MKSIIKRVTITVMIASIICNTMILSVAAASDKCDDTFLWDDWATIEKHLDNAPAAAPISEKVDLTNKFPKPGDQIGPSCTAWAVCYAYKSSQEYIKRGWSKDNEKHLFSAAYTFNKLSDGSHGIHISDAMENIKQAGVCSSVYFPNEKINTSTKPTSKENGAAALYKSSSWNTIKGITAIKNHIAGGDGVVVAIQVYPDFDNISSTNQIYDNASGELRGGHSICLIGYDDSKKAFKFINSWGTDWGLNGYGWISYDMITNKKVNFYGEAIGYVMHPATDNYFVGDINEDGTISADDAQLVLQYVTKLKTFTSRQFALADVDGNAVVDAEDSNYILQFVVKKISKMPLYN